MEIMRGKISGAKKVVIYGPEGIGKSTFASQFPDPVFIDTEGSTRELDVARLPEPASWTYLKEEVRYVIDHPDVCRTLVIDTADWAERLAIESVLNEYNKNGIEDFGYGNGYRYVYERFGELLNLLTQVVSKGIHVVLTAHAALRKFEQPDEMGSYDRYAMKLIDSPKTSICATVKEWADIVLFANYKTIVVTDNKTKKTKAQGGRRVMYTTHHSCWDAKNRYGLPDELPFTYEAIREVIEGKAQNTKTSAPEIFPVTSTPEKPAPAPKAEKPKAPEPVASANEVGTESPEPEEDLSLEKIREESPVTEADLDKRIPKALRDLMLKDNIAAWDIENYVNARGYAPPDTPIWELETVNPGIIEGLLVAQWPGVRDVIRQMRRDLEIPFN